MERRYPMKVAISVVVALAFPALLFGQAVASRSTRSGSSAEQEVRQMENARREAILHNAVAALDRLIADSYLETLGDGRLVKKADVLAVNRSSDRQVESYGETDG